MAQKRRRSKKSGENKKVYRGRIGARKLGNLQYQKGRERREELIEE